MIEGNGVQKKSEKIEQIFFGLESKVSENNAQKIKKKPSYKRRFIFVKS